MTEQEILEGNKLIGEFMECEFSPECAFIRSGYIRGWIPFADLHYNTAWDWLMPVVEKIESLSNLIVKKVWIDINGCGCGIHTYFDPKEVLRTDNKNGNGVFKVKHTSDSKINSTFRAVIDFIKWYNEQSTPKVK